MFKGKDILKNMLNKAWGLIVAADSTWDSIASEQASVTTIRKNYIYPWILCGVILSFIFNGIYAPARPIEAALVHAIITLLSLTGGYYISNLVCFAYLNKYKPDLASKNKCETIVGYSYTIIILIEILITIMPSLFFLRILSLFVAYSVWEGSRAIWQLNEEERGSVVLIFSIIIIFMPIIVNKIIHILLPNA